MKELIDICKHMVYVSLPEIEGSELIAVFREKKDAYEYAEYMHKKSGCTKNYYVKTATPS